MFCRRLYVYELKADR